MMSPNEHGIFKYVEPTKLQKLKVKIALAVGAQNVEQAAELALSLLGSSDPFNKLNQTAAMIEAIKTF